MCPSTGRRSGSIARRCEETPFPVRPAQVSAVDAPSSTCRNHPDRPSVDAVSGLCEECARTPEQRSTLGETARPAPQLVGSVTLSALPSNSEIRASDILPAVLRDTDERLHSGAEVNLITRDY